MKFIFFSNALIAIYKTKTIGDKSFAAAYLTVYCIFFVAAAATTD